MAKDRDSLLGPDADLLEEIRTRFDYAYKEWDDIRKEARTDMRCVAGDPWNEKDRKAREDAGRPCLALDELGQYFNQVINDVRSNPRAPKFSPTGNGADEKSAEFYGNKMREIEYRSQAQIAYTTAFQDCVHRSYGWCRVNTKFGDRSFDQDLWIEDIPNPDLIIADPDATRPTSSDMKYLFYIQTRTRDEFTREFPDAQITDFAPEIVSSAPMWIKDDTVQIAEYWKVETQTKKLLLVQPPAVLTQGQPQPAPAPLALYDDELEQMPDGAKILASRSVDVPSVCMYLTNGVEILKKPGFEKRIEWAGKYIPFISCFGMILYVNEGSGIRRKLLSMTRLARDPYMLYCYYRTAEAEQVGMSTKFPYFVRRGSLKPDQQVALQQSLHEPVAFIQVEHTVDGAAPGMVPEMPVRNPFEPAIQALEVGAEGARRAIQAAMGVSPLPTQAQRHNEKSGIALKQIQESGQRGSFHFIDHYEAMIQQVGVVCEDLMDKILDTPRETAIREANDKAGMVKINYENDPESISVKGSHAVTVSTGPAFESQRMEAAAFSDALLSNLQMVAAVSGPQAAAQILGLTVKLKELGPIGDEIAKILTPQEGQPQIPPQLQQQMQQMQQENAQLKELADKNKTELEKANISADKDLALQVMRNAATIAVAHIAAAAKGADINAHAAEEATALQHEAVQNEHDRQHEAALNMMDHQQALEQGQMGHQQALEQGDQSHQQAIEQQAMQPEPGAEA